MKRARKSKRSIYPTLAAMVSGFAEGLVSAAEMNSMISAIEQGIGLEKRDRAIAEALESAPPSFEEHPMYMAGFEAACAAIRDHADGCAIVGCTSPVPHAPAPEVQRNPQ